MVIKNIAMLCAVSIRTVAYLQVMKQSELQPEICLILAENQNDCLIKHEHNELENRYFEIEKNFIHFLESEGIQYQIVGTRNANEDMVYEKVKQLQHKYVIYSGYGGCILDKRLLECGKKFIHIHAGRLPEYRGSTTAYYSILNEKKISATGIFMNEKIDEGEVILSETFSLPEAGISMDYVYEPWVRANVLVSILKRFLEKGEINGNKQQGHSETYYIIHPVLKHIALLSIEEGSK